MAIVDFSNAVLQPNPNGYLPMTRDKLMSLDETSVLMNGSGYSMVSSSNKTVLVYSPTKVSVMYNGTFNTSGDGFYIGNNQTWKVSNISFANGDSYAFVIDVETSGNT